MIIIKRWFGIVIFPLGLILFFGCAAGGSHAGWESAVRQPVETRAETVSAVKSVAEGISGHELSDEELNDLGRRIQKDPETQSAIQAITGAMGSEPPVVKYCPVCGKRYSSGFKECPIHHVPLKEVEE